MPDAEVMTIDDLADYLKLSKSTLYKLSQEGKVPGRKVGKHWRFSKPVIERWLEDQQPSDTGNQSRGR